MSPSAPAAGAVAPDWIVLKFGGTSVSRRHRWDTIGQLMKRRAGEEGARVLVVRNTVPAAVATLKALEQLTLAQGGDWLFKVNDIKIYGEGRVR